MQNSPINSNHLINKKRNWKKQMENSDLKLFSISKAAKELHIGKEKLYELMRQGKIGWIRIGKRIVIPYMGIIKFIEENLTYNVTETSLVNNKILNKNNTIEFNSMDIFNRMKGDL